MNSYMTIPRSLIFHIVILVFCLQAMGNPPPVSVEELKSKAPAIIKAFRQKRIELGYPASVIQKDNNKAITSFKVVDEEDGVELRNDSYWVGFSKETGKFDGFLDNNISLKQLGKEAPTFSTRNKPKWPSEKAIDLAKPFFETFLNDKEFHFAAPGAKYEYTMPNKEGFWEAIWPRTDSKGHPFEYDEYVSVSISESYGPYALTVSLHAHYVEQPGEPLKQVDVQDKALEMAKKTLIWGPVKGMLDPGHLDPKPFIAQLKVVKPNHMLDHAEVDTHSDLNARLAWVFWYAWRLDNNPKKNQSVSVWIDAYTGEILGGDAGL